MISFKEVRLYFFGCVSVLCVDNNIDYLFYFGICYGKILYVFEDEVCILLLCILL